MTESFTVADVVPSDTNEARPAAPNRPRRARGRATADRPRAGVAASARSNPVLVELAQRYPGVFGEQPVPLKRGIFQDLLDAHPQAWEREALKAALAWHTRSSRYLNAMASGQGRHDLQGQVVEPVAPEHALHALLEVTRRRLGAQPEGDDRLKCLRRLAQVFEQSGLDRDAFVALLQGKDAWAHELVQEALAQVAERWAREDALLRQWERSGLAVADFASAYGLAVRAVQTAVAHARRRAGVDPQQGGL